MTRRYNRAEAIRMDKAGEFYADFDEETNAYCVFGTESGFAYSNWSDKEVAEDEAEKMNKRFSKS